MIVLFLFFITVSLELYISKFKIVKASNVEVKHNNDVFFTDSLL